MDASDQKARQVTPSNGIFSQTHLPEASFGNRLTLNGSNLAASIAALEASAGLLTEALNAAQGLLVLSDLQAIFERPELLVRMSRLLGPEVENYRKTLTPANRIHPSVAEILVLSNEPPSDRQPPARPSPALTPAGDLPVQFPHRRGWHTDQSFRRPPPDSSLFYCCVPAPADQAQTLYANGTLAYAALPANLRAQVAELHGLHALIGTGRSEQAAKENVTPMALQPHQRSQRQPVVRVHPDTGQPALFLCEAGQMDWVDGPFIGMETGPYGAGAKLLYELMTHYTAPQFTYTHQWRAGDLVIYDNRCLIHCATWFDAKLHRRLMWRTTVMGNPGREYAKESKSWLAPDDGDPMAGLDNYNPHA